MTYPVTYHSLEGLSGPCPWPHHAGFLGALPEGTLVLIVLAAFGLAMYWAYRRGLRKP